MAHMLQVQAVPRHVWADLAPDSVPEAAKVVILQLQLALWTNMQLRLQEESCSIMCLCGPSTPVTMACADAASPYDLTVLASAVPLEQGKQASPDLNTCSVIA